MDNKTIKMERRTTKDYLKMGMMASLIIGMGLLAINQGLGYYYKSELLQRPCELCVSLNPQFKECFIKTEYVGNNNNEFKFNFSLGDSVPFEEID